MTDIANPGNIPDEEDNSSDTLIVPPPNFRERLLAAQRARANGARPGLEIAKPANKPEEQESPAAEPPVKSS
jgi:hypothetical protein